MLRAHPYRRRVRRALLVAALVAAAGPAGAQSAQEILARFGVEPYDGPMNQLLLGDYEPHSSLVVPEHHPPRARFPVVDFHLHPMVQSPEHVEQWVKLMDQAGVETAIVLAGPIFDDVDRLVKLFLEPHPGRFQLYCNLDTRRLDIEAPEFPEQVAADLERCYRKGGRGVGEVVDKGWGIGGSEADGRPRDRRLHVDDPRLDPFWKKCAELKLPVSLHVADHPSAWEPDDRHQERDPSFQWHNKHGRDVASHEELMAGLVAALERHPKTTFVAVHLANLGHDLARLGRLLDRFPNLYLDISARAYEFGRQPFTAHDFFVAYQDRILFGSDQQVNQTMWPSWWRILETRDEYIEGSTWWRLYGLGLPDEVLEAVYRGNARRLLNWTPR